MYIYSLETKGKTFYILCFDKNILFKQTLGIIILHNKLYHCNLEFVEFILYLLRKHNRNANFNLIKEPRYACTFAKDFLTTFVLDKNKFSSFEANNFLAFKVILVLGVVESYIYIL